MSRKAVRHGACGLRVTPSTIRGCWSFLKRAVALVNKGLPDIARGSRPAWGLRIRPAAAPHRRP
jgi:hypothetical protein